MRALALSALVLVASCSSSPSDAPDPGADAAIDDSAGGADTSSPSDTGGAGDDGGADVVADALPADAPATGDAPKADAAADVAPAEDAYVDEAGTWSVTWRDEFNGADGAEIDRTKWAYDDPQSGKYNKELEYYVAGKDNAEQRGGNLVITAKSDGASKYTCWYGPCRYTAARVFTKGLYATKYGRIAARIQIPRGQGLWPAFWLLGDDIDAVSWPACGEIDVMENVGSTPKTDYGTLHAPGFNKGLSTDAPSPLADDFHVYAAEWDAKGIRIFLDERLYATLTPADVPAGGKWAFDHPFFLLLNVAVGGGWPGDPDATSTFPQTMKVDWVRVYTKG